MSEKRYTKDNIQVLQGLEGVRKRPGMYIGAADFNGLHQLIWEILDNALDEAMSGFGDKITITLRKDGALVITDEGRGIPFETHPVSGKSTLETVFSVLHAGGKFDDGAYRIASGLHGVGASVVNALSEYMEVTTYHDYKIHAIRFVRGVTDKQGLRYLGTTNKTGTHVIFKPDPTLFVDVHFDPKTIGQRLSELSYLINNLKIIFRDEINKKEEVYHQTSGLQSYITDLCGTNEPLIPAVTCDNDGLLDDSGITIKAIFTYLDNFDSKIISYVNNIKTYDGGTHETGLKNAFTRAFNDYAKEHNLLKGRSNLDGEDVREGLVLILSIYVPEKIIQFGNQIKSKLTTKEARPSVENFLYTSLTYYLRENAAFAKSLVKKMITAFDARSQIKKTKTAVAKSNKTYKLNGKLSPAQSKNKADLELFIVEGDSAGGSAKGGRDSKYQAILPLRGKVTNVENKALQALQENEEFATIVHTIGTGIGKDFNLKNLNYNKIIIMTDADSDGSHIQILLLTLIYRFMRPLIEEGYIYIAQPPLYKITKSGGKTFRYCFDEQELAKAKADFKNYLPIQRYKGLGEMNPEQLWETTMNPATRSLLQLRIEDLALVEQHFNLLMGDASPGKKKFIEDNVQFVADQFVGE